MANNKIYVTKTEEITENSNTNEHNSINESVTNNEKHNISNEKVIPNELHFNIRFNSIQTSEFFELMKIYQYGKKSDTIHRAVSEALRFQKIKENMRNSELYRLVFNDSNEI